MIGALLCAFPAYATDTAILMSSGAAMYVEAEEGIRSVLKGNTLTFVMDGERDPDNKKLVRKLREEDADVLLVIGSPALQVAVAEFSQTPLIFCFVLDYVSVAGALMAKETSDVSGVAMTVPPGEQIRALTEINPQIKRLGVVYDKSKSGGLVEQLNKASKALGIRIVARDVDNKEDAVNAIAKLQGEIDAYLMLPDTTVTTPETVKYLLLFSFKNQIALVGLSEKYVKQGALLSLSFDSKAIGKQVGALANEHRERLATGNKGRIVDPKPLRLFVNKNTSEQMNIKIPDSVLKKAYQVF